MISDATVLLALITIVATAVGTLSYISKRNADGKLLALRQKHERDMAELETKQSGETNLSGALLAVARSMQAHVDAQRETNHRYDDERRTATEQAKAFTATVAANADAKLALSTAIDLNTRTLELVKDDVINQFLNVAGEVAKAKTETVDALTEVITNSDEGLGKRFDSLKVSVEEALVEMRRGITDYGKVTNVLERVVAALNKQEHDANNETQVAALMAVNARRKTGEHAAVPNDNENGSSD